MVRFQALASKCGKTGKARLWISLESLCQFLPADSEKGGAEQVNQGVRKIQLSEVFRHLQPRDPLTPQFSRVLLKLPGKDRGLSPRSWARAPVLPVTEGSCASCFWLASRRPEKMASEEPPKNLPLKKSLNRIYWSLFHS